jgi:hypothetical protein
MRFSDIPRNPDSRTLRQFAALWIVFFGAIGGMQLDKGNALGWPIWGLAACAGIPGLVWPWLLKPVFVTWMIVAFPIGWLISHLLLALMFYGLFAPLGLILKATGHDPLKRTKPATGSYWEAKAQQKDMSRYLKQF